MNSNSNLFSINDSIIANAKKHILIIQQEKKLFDEAFYNIINPLFKFYHERIDTLEKHLVHNQAIISKINLKKQLLIQQDDSKRTTTTSIKSKYILFIY
jgi:hypothetical protein